ncbi:unnamed protein product, partial [Medioppia subpectinata]
ALRVGKESAPHLTDANLAITIFDLFFAGTDTSQQTFQWMLLFIAYYPAVQRRLRAEVEAEVGADRMPRHEDRNRCHYCMAFIAEALRYRNVAPFGVGHNTVCRTTIDKYTIPENTGILVYQGYIMRNEKEWERAND